MGVIYKITIIDINPMVQLTIQEFISNSDINVDQLYIDKFWSNISEDKWIYVGSDMLKWIGYDCTESRHDKRTYIELLQRNFIESTNYRIISTSEIKDFYREDILPIEMPDQIDPGNRTNHLIVSPDCFKESLMIMTTDRAKQIRMYYLQLEKVYNQYKEYTYTYKLQEQTKQLQLKDDQLKEALSKINSYQTMVIKKASFKCDQYVYVATSRNYAKQNVFKVGMTKSLEKRMSGYQTGRVLDDKFSYLYLMKCVDAKALEQLIFTRLEPFRYDDSKELFQIHFETLKDILSIFEKFETESVNSINQLLSDYYSKYDDMPAIDFESLIIPNLDEYFEERFNITPIDRYVPIIDPQSSPFSLTTEQVNDRLNKFGIKLIGEYSGKCEESHWFECSSPLNHKFESSFKYINSTKHCSYCGNERILDRICIHEYTDRTYDYVKTYITFDELKKAKPDLNHQLLRNIIREKRWLTPHEGHIYSILSPYDNKLSLTKPLTAEELFIIDVLRIDFKSMYDRISNSVLNYIIALDKDNKIAYFGKSATEMGCHLKQLNSNKKINRKTITKRIVDGVLYGGYKWIKHDSNVYQDYTMVDVDSLV